jgi:hypothetical protein
VTRWRCVGAGEFSLTDSGKDAASIPGVGENLCVVGKAFIDALAQVLERNQRVMDGHGYHEKELATQDEKQGDRGKGHAPAFDVAPRRAHAGPGCGFSTRRGKPVSLDVVALEPVRRVVAFIAVTFRGCGCLFSA